MFGKELSQVGPIVTHGRSHLSPATLAALEMLQSLKMQIEQTHLNMFIPGAMPKPENGIPYTAQEIDFIVAHSTPRMVLKNSQEAINLIKEHMDVFNSLPYAARSAYLSITIHDFESMYTKLPLVDVLLNHRKEIEAIQDRIIAANMLAPGSTPTHLLLSYDMQKGGYAVEKVFAHTKDGELTPIVKHYDPESQTLFSYEQYIELFEFVMKSSMFCFNGKVKLQSSGIGQGLEISTEVANTFCGTDERLFIEQLISKREWKLLDVFCKGRHGIQGRFVDDIISIGRVNECYTRFLYKNVLGTSPYTGVKLHGIYTGDGTGFKLCLDQTLNAETGYTVHYLDLELFYDVVQRRMHYRQYDKRSDEKYCMSALPRFSTAKSLVWSACLYTPVFSELHRHLSSSSHISFFITTAAHTLIEMYSKGLDWNKLAINLYKFLSSNLHKIKQHPDTAYNSVMREAMAVWTIGHPMVYHRAHSLNLEMFYPIPSVQPSFTFKHVLHGNNSF